MKKYIKIDNDGNIIQLIQPQYDNPIDGYIAIDDDGVSALTHYYKDGQLIKYTDLEQADKNNYKRGFKWVPTIGWVDQRDEETRNKETLQQNKTKRNQLLAESDWTQMPDVSITNKTDWAVYRQQLRDMTDSDLITGNFPAIPTINKE